MHVNEFITDFGSKARLSESDLSKVDNMTFLIDGTIAAFMQQLPKKPAYVGVLLATQNGSHFIPGRYLLEHLNKDGVKAVVADKNGSWLTICGKDLWGKSIISTRGDPQVGDKVLILNEHDEVLGYGVMARDIGAKTKMAVELKFDLGDYLRREKGVFKKRY